MSAPNATEVERLVSCLMSGVASFGETEGSNMVSAVLTFANRFLRSAIDLSQGAGARKENVQQICRALKIMAAMIEADESKDQQVH